MVTTTRSKCYEMDQQLSGKKKKGISQKGSSLERRFSILKTKVMQLENNVKVLLKNNQVLNKRILKLQSYVADLVNDSQIANCKNHVNIKENTRPGNSDSVIVNVTNKNLYTQSKPNSGTGDVTKTGKSRILFLADSHGREIFNILQSLDTAHEYKILNIFKPNAEFEEVIKDVATSTKDFNEKDYVVVFAGSNNALNNNTININTLRNALNNLKGTNVVLISIPYWCNGNKTINNNIYYLNCEIFKEIKSNYSDIRFIDSNCILKTNCYTQYGLHLNKRGKYKLLRYIFDCIKKDSNVINSINYNNLKVISISEELVEKVNKVVNVNNAVEDEDNHQNFLKGKKIKRAR